MTIAHPGAEYCALCMLKGVATPAMPEWPGAPLCKWHVVECIEANERPVIVPDVDISSQSLH
jgi:hypothetical protein